MKGMKNQYAFKTVEEVRHARTVEKRSLAWISARYSIPIDTIRDWIYRGARMDQ